MGTVWLIRLLAFLLLCCVSGCRPSRNQAETVCVADSFRLFEAGLYPDLHSNRAGRYRFFYDIILDDTRQGVKMMAEFRLSDDEEELKNRTRNTHQELPLSSGPNASAEVKYTLSADYVYECVEEMPEFPGGLSALLGFVKEHLRYPESTRKDGLQGRVVVGVVIDEEGNVTQSCIFRSISSQLDAEALRVIGLLPKWKPGRLRGKPVKVRFAIPVTFKL